ncbi:unnamed protein product [Mytilus edulis]|uniref:ZSWIM3 N-terminal domain-containing protein n=1 Tax=Mytilus edulis TaxID=6550 RepID=A0A8S3TRR5_MYTED|nr:unnamed protein product [Mytilus edulis]
MNIKTLSKPFSTETMLEKVEVTKNESFICKTQDTPVIENNLRDSRTIESARKRGIKRELSEDLQFNQIRYSCINGGKEHNSKTNGERPKQSSFRKGCPAYFSVGVSEDGKFLVVKSIEDHHNHVISKGLFEMLPRERRLPEEELKEAEKLVSLQVNNKLMRITCRIKLEKSYPERHQQHNFKSQCQQEVR